MGETMIHVEHTFEMAHRCPGHGYGEDSIHGHTWTVKTSCTAIDGEISDEPLLLSDLIYENVVQVLDHGLMVWQDDDLSDFFEQLEKNNLNLFKVDFNPTLRNIATYLFGELKPLLYDSNFDLQSIVLSEGARISVAVTSGVFSE